MLAGGIAGLLLIEIVCRIAMEDEPNSPMSVFGRELLPRRIDDLRELVAYHPSDPYVEPDSRLGWTIVPGAWNESDVLYAADELGMRVLPEAKPRVRATRGPRIAAFGDSFTHCDEVPFEDCWTHLVASDLGAEVINGGVPGYGTDQAYLRYLETRASLTPEVVVLGLMIGDIVRNVNVFRVFLGTWTIWTKPRFVLDGDGIALINQPTLAPEGVPDAIEDGHPLLAHDWWYDPTHWQGGLLAQSVAFRYLRARTDPGPDRSGLMIAGGEPLEVTARIVEAFAADVERDGGRFLCVILPSDPDLLRIEPVRWQPLLTRLREADIEVVDPTVALRERSRAPGLFRPGGHYARAGNEIVAASVLRAMYARPADVFEGEHEPERDTIGVFEPTTRTFMLRNANTSGAADVVARFGPARSMPLMGDFDGDGIDTFAVYQPETAEFSLAEVNDEGPAVLRFRFGRPGARVVPIVGDWDGRGGDSIGHYDPILGRFRLRNSNSKGPPDIETNFGPEAASPGSIAIAGNWSGGDATDGIGLYDPATGRFYLKDDASHHGPADHQFGLGRIAPDLIPIAGDWDGNGSDDVGLYDPAERTFFLRTGLSSGTADRAFRFGPSHMLPVAGNFDGR